MTATTEPVGIFKCFPDHLWKHYFVIGKGIGSGNGIAKWFKDPAEKWMDTNSHTDIVKSGSNVQIIIITISQYHKDYTAQK